MDLVEKLTILADAAKYDVACTSSGVDRKAQKGSLGNAVAAGICHSFAADGRCISLLKVLMSNACAYDCSYCVNRRTQEGARRATFTPKELADLTIAFYRRNYIEGLFLSSAVVGTPDYTSELMLKSIRILREEHRFQGYIHVKGIPGTDDRLIEQLGLYADRMSVNIELPTENSLTLLAPEKTRQGILRPMEHIRDGILENKNALTLYRSAPKFAPAGQSTQMIVGATPESDHHILTLSEGLYRKYRLRRVFFSAYIPMLSGSNLPSLDTRPPLLREHRLYQADWLMRFYGFEAKEILSDAQPNFDPLLDPKCNWALNNLDQFPVEVNRAPHELLLRVPGIGVKSSWRILQARKSSHLDFAGLKKLGVVLKRAQYFITCLGKCAPGAGFSDEQMLRAMLSDKRPLRQEGAQLSMLDPSGEDVLQCLTGQL